MLFLWEQAKDLCLCLFRWHHLSTIPYIRYPAVLSAGPHFLLTQQSMIGLKFHWSCMRQCARCDLSNLSVTGFLKCYCAKGHHSVHLCLCLISSTVFGLWPSDAPEKGDLLLLSLSYASSSHKWQMPWFVFVVVSKKSSLEQVAH